MRNHEDLIGDVTPAQQRKRRKSEIADARRHRFQTGWAASEIIRKNEIADARRHSWLQKVWTRPVWERPLAAICVAGIRPMPATS